MLQSKSEHQKFQNDCFRYLIEITDSSIWVLSEPHISSYSQSREEMFPSFPIDLDEELIEKINERNQNKKSWTHAPDIGMVLKEDVKSIWYKNRIAYPSDQIDTVDSFLDKYGLKFARKHWWFIDEELEGQRKFDFIQIKEKNDNKSIVVLKGGKYLHKTFDVKYKHKAGKIPKKEVDKLKIDSILGGSQNCSIITTEYAELQDYKSSTTQRLLFDTESGLKTIKILEIDNYSRPSFISREEFRILKLPKFNIVK